MCGFRHSAERGSARSRMWATLRRRPIVSEPFLQTVASASQSNVRAYMQALVRVGYVERISRKSRGDPASATTYRLVRNTGPKPPRYRGGPSIYDPNTGEEVRS